MQAKKTCRESLGKGSDSVYTIIPLAGSLLFFLFGYFIGVKVKVAGTDGGKRCMTVSFFPLFLFYREWLSCHWSSVSSRQFHPAVKGTAGVYI